MDPTSLAKHAAFRAVLADLMRVRYVAPEEEVQTTFEGIRSARPTAAHVVGGNEWSLPISNWKARPRFAESGSFYDDATTLRRAFDVDWSLAIRSHDLAGYIKKHDDGDDEAARYASGGDDEALGGESVAGVHLRVIWARDKRHAAPSAPGPVHLVPAFACFEHLSHALLPVSTTATTNSTTPTATASRTTK